MEYALVTGASRGIGKAIAIALAMDGFHVLINYRSNEQEAVDTLKNIQDNGGIATLLPFDVSDKRAIRVSIENWKSENPDHYIQVLVNNAGVTRDNLLVFMEDEQWEEVIHTNLNSVYYLSRILVQDMILKKGGRIINIVSLSGLKGQAGQVNYSAAKAGVIGLTKSLALELGKKKITVNAVAPGFITTDMTANLPEAELKKMIPLNRFGKAEEVAHLVSFLASPKAAYITGETIQINGGLYTR
jgi:3-oxoacyl-[acyl-carrier protein] reductase